MKRVVMLLLLTLFCVNSLSHAANGDFTVTGSVGINPTPNAVPAASAALDITNTTKGFLPPRMTTAQRNAIALPAMGLLIYNTTENTYNFYTGTTWLPLGGTPAGHVSAYAGTTLPTGWLKCNGAAVSRTTYAALFAAIGTTYGTGDGSTTFNLPDLRGEFVRGWDDSRGVDAGRTVGSWQVDLFKSHTHEQRHGLYANSDYYDSTSAFGNNGSWIASNDTWQYTGGAETRPRNVALMYCIKY